MVGIVLLLTVPRCLRVIGLPFLLPRLPVDDFGDEASTAPVFSGRLFGSSELESEPELDVESTLLLVAASENLCLDMGNMDPHKALGLQICICT